MTMFVPGDLVVSYVGGGIRMTRTIDLLCSDGALCFHAGLLIAVFDVAIYDDHVPVHVAYVFDRATGTMGFVAQCLIKCVGEPK